MTSGSWARCGTPSRKLSKQSSVRESVSELGQLMATSEERRQLRRGSSLSLANGDEMSPMFRPPSNLPPVENGEVIVLDIEAYRLIMQDVQNLKTLLYRFANGLREPGSASYFGSESGDLMTQGDEFQMTSCFFAGSSKVI